MPFYNEKEGRWNFFYVAYINKPKTDYNPVHIHGKIWRAASTKSGPLGLGGPYKDIEIVLRPDSTSGPWEGVQGTDSFFLYPVNDSFYAYFGSFKKSPEEKIWGTGLAKADDMTGPWTRRSDLNPVLMDDYFTENPVVAILDDGRYIAFLDAGIHGKFAYSVSNDGIHWSKGTFVDMNNHPDKWWELMHKPLSCIHKGGGITL